MRGQASASSSDCGSEWMPVSGSLGDHAESIPTAPSMSPQEEKRLVRKLDFRILPVLTALML